MSNILKIFQKNQEQQPIEQEECLGCLLTAATVMTFGGAYLASGMVFYNKGQPLPDVTPTYKFGVRTAGGAVTLFGLYRAYQAYDFYSKHGWGGFQ